MLSILNLFLIADKLCVEKENWQGSISTEISSSNFHEESATLQTTGW